MALDRRRLQDVLGQRQGRGKMHSNSVIFPITVINIQVGFRVDL